MAVEEHPHEEKTLPEGAFPGCQNGNLVFVFLVPEVELHLKEKGLCLMERKTETPKHLKTDPHTPSGKTCGMG